MKTKILASILLSISVCGCNNNLNENSYKVQAAAKEQEFIDWCSKHGFKHIGTSLDEMYIPDGKKIAFYLKFETKNENK